MEFERKISTSPRTLMSMPDDLASSTDLKESSNPLAIAQTREEFHRNFGPSLHKEKISFPISSRQTPYSQNRLPSVDVIAPRGFTKVSSPSLSSQPFHQVTSQPIIRKISAPVSSNNFSAKDVIDSQPEIVEKMSVETSNLFVEDRGFSVKPMAKKQHLVPLQCLNQRGIESANLRVAEVEDQCPLTKNVKDNCDFGSASRPECNKVSSDSTLVFGDVRSEKRTSGDVRSEEQTFGSDQQPREKASTSVFNPPHIETLGLRDHHLSAKNSQQFMKKNNENLCGNVVNNLQGNLVGCQGNVPRDDFIKASEKKLLENNIENGVNQFPKDAIRNEENNFLQDPIMNIVDGFPKSPMHSPVAVSSNFAKPCAVDPGSVIAQPEATSIGSSQILKVEQNKQLSGVALNSGSEFALNPSHLRSSGPGMMRPNRFGGKSFVIDPSKFKKSNSSLSKVEKRNNDPSVSTSLDSSAPSTKRKLRADQITVIGGYVKLPRSTLADPNKHKKHVKVNFNEKSLESIHEYPSEISFSGKQDPEKRSSHTLPSRRDSQVGSHTAKYLLGMKEEIYRAADEEED